MATTGSVALKRQRMSGTMDALHDHPAPEAGSEVAEREEPPRRTALQYRSGECDNAPAPQVCEIRKAGRAYRKRLTTTTSVRARPRHHGKAQLTRRHETTPQRAGRTLRRQGETRGDEATKGRKLMLESTGRWEIRRLWTPRDIYRAAPRPGPTRPLRGVPSLTYGPNRESEMTETSDSPKRTRAPNPLWDMLVKIFEYTPLLRGEQKLWGQIVRDFAEAGVTADQIERAAKGYRRLYPQAAFTPTALRSQFSAALAEGTPRRPRLRVVDDDASQETVPPPAGLFDSWKAGNA
jgi:hypothetical protein